MPNPPYQPDPFTPGYTPTPSGPPPPVPPPNMLQQLAASISQGASGIMNAPTGAGMPYDPFGSQGPATSATPYPVGPSPGSMLQQLLASVQGLPQQPWVKKQIEAARVRSGPGVEGLSPADVARIVGESGQQQGQMPRQ
jgi:hypothetical protein